MNKKYTYNKKKTPLFKQPKIIIGVALVMLLALVGTLYATDTFPFTKKIEDYKETTTVTSNTKGETEQPAPQSDVTSQDSSQSSEEKSQTNSTSNTPHQNTKLKKPEGNFVNNHRPSLANSSEMQSSCVTTPGASCQIIFTKDGVTKTLENKTTDAGGGAYWAWTLQSAGLTTGTWQVKAVATIGSQTETEIDAMNMEVTP